MFFVRIISSVVQQNPPSLSDVGQKDSPNCNLGYLSFKYPCFTRVFLAFSRIGTESLLFNAGIRTTSHLSAIGEVNSCSNKNPAKSVSCHLVITSTTFPPGINLVRKPEEYHSFKLSLLVLEKASCSDIGSSMIAKCAPNPAIPEPEPAARKDPACFFLCSSAHEFAALLSLRIFICGNIDLYASVFMMSRMARPNLVAKSSLCDTAISCQYGLRPSAHAGKYVDVINDLLERGDIKIIKRSVSPFSNFISWSHKTLWCGPTLNVGFISITNANKSSRA